MAKQVFNYADYFTGRIAALLPGKASVDVLRNITAFCVDVHYDARSEMRDELTDIHNANLEDARMQYQAQAENYCADINELQDVVMDLRSENNRLSSALDEANNLLKRCVSEHPPLMSLTAPAPGSHPDYLVEAVD